MAQYFTSSTLISSVKRRAMIPSNQSTFADADFLAFANEEISLGLLPSILRLHEDYYLYTQDVALVSGQSKYEIPDRAIGNKLRDVHYKDSNDNLHEMTRIGIQDQSYYNDTNIESSLSAFYVESNQIVLKPDLSGTASGSLSMSFYIRPNELVAETRAATITAIDTDTGIVTVDQIPDGFTTSLKYDFIKGKSPFVHLAIDITSSAIDTSTKEITFTPSDLPSRLEIGDYINFQYETIVPQIPLDLHVVLAHRVAARCLEALGDTEGLQNANTKLAEMEVSTTNLIDNRVEGAPKKIVNRRGLLRSGLYRRR